MDFAGVFIASEPTARSREEPKTEREKQKSHGGQEFLLHGTPLLSIDESASLGDGPSA